MESLKITSKDNAHIKHLKKLIADREYRYETRQYAIEGVRALDGLERVSQLFIREGTEHPRLGYGQLFVVERQLFDRLASTEHSQGIIAVAELRLLGVAGVEQNGRYVLLDRLQDPGNMGAIIRSACAFGMTGIIITPGTVDPFSPKVVRAAVSAVNKMAVIAINGIDELRGSTLIAADTAGEDAGAFAWPAGFILAIGNEANGLSTELKQRAERTVAIPLKGAMESLNAAVAAGILLYCSSLA